MPVTLTFHGGAGTVTGSRFEVEAAGHHVLVDCGMFQGLKELRLRNWARPAFDPSSIEAVFLTHAHIDHSGSLPRLVREGFRGPIWATRPTLDLAHILLLDAGRLQEEDAEYANRKGFSKHRPALPLFTERDARDAIARMKAVAFGKTVEAGPFRATFHQAGHILGSAFVALEAIVARRTVRIVFSGDLGRADRPLHVDPDPLPACDVLVLEATYGDRAHDRRTLAEQIARPFRRTIERGGTVLIPAFAVARAQMVTLLLRELMESGELPQVPIHIDSPMATDVTGIYDRYLGTGHLDPVTKGRTQLFPHHVQFHRTVQQSKGLNLLPGPRIIISASGMLTGGRVLHHLERLLPGPENLVVLVGYQPAGTRGRALQRGASTLRMHGRDVPVRAELMSVEGLSAHADRDELLAWVDSAPVPPGEVFLAHGEPEALASLAEALRKKGLEVTVPDLGDSYQLEAGAARWGTTAAPPSTSQEQV